MNGKLLKVRESNPPHLVPSETELKGFMSIEKQEKAKSTKNNVNGE